MTSNRGTRRIVPMWGAVFRLPSIQRENGRKGRWVGDKERRCRKRCHMEGCLCSSGCCSFSDGWRGALHGDPSDLGPSELRSVQVHCTARMDHWVSCKADWGYIRIPRSFVLCNNLNKKYSFGPNILWIVPDEPRFLLPIRSMSENVQWRLKLRIS